MASSRSDDKPSLSYRDAGVDMESPHPVETALQRFDRLVLELDELI